MHHILRPVARRSLILGLRHIGRVPSLKSAVLRFLRRRPSWESHMQSFCEAHHLSLFENTGPPATAEAIAWTDYDPAVRRIYARLAHMHLSQAPLSQARPPASVGHHEARH